MKLLITEHQGTPVVDTRVIAEQCNIEHRSAFRLLNEHLEVIETELGAVRFEIALGKKLPQGGVGEGARHALLTEDQATALITMFKNSAVVVRFKVRLAKAFGELKRERKAKLPSYGDLARMVLEQEQKLGLCGDVFGKILPTQAYGSISANGKPRLGIRRAAFVAAASRYKDAARFLQLSAQLELEGLE